MNTYKYYVYFHAFFLWNELLQYYTTKTYGFWNIFMLLQLSRMFFLEKKKHIRVDIKIIENKSKIGKPTTILLYAPTAHMKTIFKKKMM